MKPNQLMIWLLSGPDREQDRRIFCSRVVMGASAIVVPARSPTILSSISIPFEKHETDVAIELAVSDWSLVKMAAKSVIGNTFSVFPCLFTDTSGEHDAIVGLIAGRPALVAYGTSDHITVHFGGFDDAAVIHDGQLASLSEEVEKQKDPIVVSQTIRRQRDSVNAGRARKGKVRKATAILRQRTPALLNSARVPLPKIVISVRALLGNIVKATGLVPIFRADKARRVDHLGLPASGPAPVDPLLTHMREGLAVAVLQTFHALRHLSLNDDGAKLEISKKIVGCGSSVEALIAIGRKCLPMWTGFDSERELDRFSETKYTALANAAFPVPSADRKSRRASELKMLETLVEAIIRAGGVTRTFDKTTKLSAAHAGIEITNAYDRRTPLKASQLIMIATVLDINPSSIIKNSEITPGGYEVCRFIGRLQRGADAFAFREHLSVIEDALTCTADLRSVAQWYIKGALEQFYPCDQILLAIARVGNGEVLHASRRDRRLGRVSE